MNNEKTKLYGQQYFSKIHTNLHGHELYMTSSIQNISTYNWTVVYKTEIEEYNV